MSTTFSYAYNGKALIDSTGAFYIPPTLTAVPTTFTFDYNSVFCPENPDTSALCTVTTPSNNSWVASPSEGWINITYGSGMGNGAFVIAVDANDFPSSPARNGTVFINHLGITNVLSINQSAEGDACA